MIEALYKLQKEETSTVDNNNNDNNNNIMSTAVLVHTISELHFNNLATVLYRTKLGFQYKEHVQYVKLK